MVNDCGELLNVPLTPGNVDDRAVVPALVQGLFGKLFGDKGYMFDNAIGLLGRGHTGGLPLIEMALVLNY